VRLSKRRPGVEPKGLLARAGFDPAPRQESAAGRHSWSGRLKKWAVAFSVFLLLIFAFAGLAFAAPVVLLDGEPLDFDVSPTIEQGRVLVPMRAIFEALGTDLDWDGPTQTVTATKDQTTVTLIIGSRTVYKTGAPIVLDVAPKIVNNRTLVPLRFVSEALGASVDWDAATQVVTIVSAPGKVADTRESLAREESMAAVLAKGNWAVHEGDLVIQGTETRAIENAKFFQKGNIYVRDHATLVIKSSELMMARGDVPTVHVYIFVDPMAKLIIDNSRIYPPPGGGTEGGLICVINRGEVRMTDSPTSIHYFDMSEGARLVMTNSEMVFTIGGLLQVTGGDTWVTDSTLGALALSVPAGAYLEVTGLHSGVYFESWDVHEMIPDADYNLVLKRTTILKDDFTGELKHGPYERGWIFFLDPDAHVRISDSELRKVFLEEVRSDTVEFKDLRTGVPSSLTYRDIVLSDVVVMGQWPFTITDSNVTITNSDNLFLQPSGLSTVKLIDSHMVEFIPRDFFGTMIFENGLWTDAGEIIGGIPHHSMANDFTIKGSLRMEGLRENLQWKDARVRREFDVIVTDAQGHPVSGVVIKVGGKAYMTDDAGKTKFKIIFNETNYNRPTAVEVWQAGRLIAQQEIDFFTETPIRIVMK